MASQGFARLFDEFEDDPLIAFVLEQFRLDRDRLGRLAVFLLAHALIDRYLIVSVGLHSIRRIGSLESPPDDQVDRIIGEAAKGTFGNHLSAAVDLTLISTSLQEIADEVNRGRNHFLHWQPGRFITPQYKGADVTDREGLRACLLDVFTVLHAVFPGSGVD